MVGAENHPRRAFALKRPRDLGRIRGYRAFEFGNPDVLVLVAATGCRIGTHNDAVQLARGVPQPFSPRLRDQRDGRSGKQNPPPILDDLLGDAKGGECLAGAACHDETASVVISQPFHGIFDGFRLKRPRLLHRPLGILLLHLNIQILPEVDLRDLGMGVADRPLGDRSPAASRHDPAQTEDRLLRAAQKLVDLAFAQRVPLVVALALYGDMLAGCSLRDQINAHVAAIEAGQGLALGPVGPAPYLVDLEFRLLKREPHEQLLEPAALLGWVAAVFADAVEDVARDRLPAQVKSGLRFPHSAARCKAGRLLVLAELRFHFFGEVACRALDALAHFKPSEAVNAGLLRSEQLAHGEVAVAHVRLPGEANAA